MAFSGLHIICAYAGSYVSGKSQALLGRVVWSETTVSGAISTGVVPGDHDAFGQPLMRLRASADSWVSVGKNPDATNGPRIFVPAGQDYDKFVEFGDRVQWVAA